MHVAFPVSARYTLFACASDQLSLSLCWTHAQNVARVSEEARHKDLSLGVGVAYDGLVRAKWETKVKHNDPGFCLATACGRIDRDVVLEAEALWPKLRAERTPPTSKAAKGDSRGGKSHSQGGKGGSDFRRGGRGYQPNNTWQHGKRTWGERDRQVAVLCCIINCLPSICVLGNVQESTWKQAPSTPEAKHRKTGK